MDRHDDDEVMELLHEAEEEVIAEIEIDQAIDAEARGDDFYSLRQTITHSTTFPSHGTDSHTHQSASKHRSQPISDEAKQREQTWAGAPPRL
jgi:hypothetical protein